MIAKIDADAHEAWAMCVLISVVVICITYAFTAGGCAGKWKSQPTVPTVTTPAQSPSQPAA